MSVTSGKSNFLMSHRGDSLREDAFADQANRPDFFIAYVLASRHWTIPGDIFIFPVDEFIALIKCGIPSKGPAKGLPLPSL